jgi:hypothetical protein
MLAEIVSAFPNAFKINPEISPVQRCAFVFLMMLAP